MKNMMKAKALLLAALLEASLITMALCAAQAQTTHTPAKAVAGAAVPSWAAMQAQVRKKWAETYAKEQVLAVEKIGDADYNEETGKTETFSGTASSGVENWEDFAWHDTSWSTTIKGREGSFLRQKVDVTVQRPDQTKAKFHVAALYKLVGHVWQFSEMPVGKVDELGGPNAAGRPTKMQAAELFKAGWTSARPEFQVKSIDVLSEDYHQYKDKQWILYKLAVHVTGTKGKFAGKSWKCEPQDFNSKLNFENGAWKASESDIQLVNEDSYCEAE